MKTLKALRKKHKQLVTAAEAFRAADGTFTDQAAFDAKMAEAETIQVQIRALEGEEDDEEPPTDPAAVERTRCIGIRAAVRAARIENGDALVDQHIGAGTGLEAFRAIVLEQLAASDRQHPTDPTHTVVPGEDARDKSIRGMSNWLLHKAGVADAYARALNPTTPDLAALDPGEFRGLTLRELARECLERGGMKTRGMDPMKMVGHAFTFRSSSTQSTSDFATLLENTMHKLLVMAYSTAPDTWSKWCHRGTVSDFRVHNRYRFGMFGGLDALLENGEFKTKAILDGEKSTIQAATKGNLVNISRQIVVNDDMGFVARIIPQLGRAAYLTVEIAAYAELAKNSGLGPTQGDSQPFFHTNRVNVGTGAAISTAAIDADATVMARQTEPNGNEYLDLQPAILLLARELRVTAQVINEAQYDPDTVANKSQMKPNTCRGMFRDVVATPRLTGTRRYLFADPSIAPAFEVVFLEGNESPVLETKDGWHVDGTEVKVRLDFGVGAIDPRGGVTNAGV